MFIWKMQQKQWERELEENLDEILAKTNLGEEKLMDIIKILDSYGIIR